MEQSSYGDAVLLGAISFLSGVVAVLARTAYTAMRDERDFLRREVLAALTAIISRAAVVAEQRDDLAREIMVRIDNLRRLVSRALRDTNSGGK